MNDAEMIADRLADEIEGGQKYRELAEQATDTKVKALFLDIASEEDSHAAWLRKLVPEEKMNFSTSESRRNAGKALFGTRKNGNIFCPATTYSSKETVRDTYPGSYAIISVDGGWLVFMTASDYTTWQGQR